MGLDKRCQKRHCRHLGVVGMAVGRRLVWSSPRWNAGPKQNGHHVYTPRAVPRCLVGLVGRPWLRALLAESSELSSLSWGVVAVRTRLAPYLSAFPAALGFAPLSASSSASSLAPLSESSSRGGATSSSLASSIINANAASSTPVRQAAFVARGHTSALWCLPHPRAFAAEAAASLLVAAALAASGRRAALTLASTVRWAAIVPHRRRRRRRSPVALPS